MATQPSPTKTTKQAPQSHSSLKIYRSIGRLSRTFHPSFFYFFYSLSSSISHHQPCTSGTTSTHGQAGMPAGNYKIYSGKRDTGRPGGTAGTHPGYMATGGYQYNLVQTREASRSLDYIDSSYLGTPLASASRSPGQLRAPGHQGIPVASLESRIWNYSTRIQSSSDSGTS